MKRKVTIEFKVNESKAVKIAKKLSDLFYNRKGFFKDYSMPEYILPRNLVKGSREHALYLTYVISIDYMTDAEKLWRNSRGAYELYPERFKPENIIKMGNRNLRAFVRRLGARFSTTGVSTWKKISTILLNKYDGDPRNITPQSLTIKEIKNKLNEFPYLRGNKLSNFYIRAMGENGLFKIKDFDELGIPVDVQVARFTIYTGVLKLLSDRFEGCVHEDPLRGLIEEAWRNAAKKVDTYPWKLDEPMWTIGSKLCTARKCYFCPVEELCDKTKGVRFKEGIAIWEHVGKKA
jgi:endonuclease III